MTSFLLHFRVANSNTFTHFVEFILRFFATDVATEESKWIDIPSCRNSRRAGTETWVRHTFVLSGLVQPILPCGSKPLYWFLWVICIGFYGWCHLRDVTCCHSINFIKLRLQEGITIIFEAWYCEFKWSYTCTAKSLPTFCRIITWLVKLWSVDHKKNI